MNVIVVGRFFKAVDTVTIDVTMAAIREGADNAAETLGLNPSILRALVKRHKRIVVRSA